MAEERKPAAQILRRPNQHIWPFEYLTAYVGICADPVSHSRPGSDLPNQARIEQGTLRPANSLGELVPYWE